MVSLRNELKNESKVFIILGLLWLIYLTIRAVFVPFTFDESATFFHFIHKGDFWFFTSLPDANNHFINSLFTYISYNLFGSSKIALRLPNLISAIIFLYYLYRCSTFIKSNPIRWVFILSLLFAHNLVEFFALSRGYGLSIAFLFGALYHLMIFSKDTSNKQIIWISFYLILAEFSNLSILVLVIAIILYQFLIIIFNTENKLISKIYKALQIIALEILPLVFASYYMFFLNSKGSLYYGNSNGFWELTIQSLILLTTGTKSIYYSILVMGFIIGLVIGVSFIWIKGKFKALFDPRLVLPFLLFSAAIGIMLLSKFLGINHPEDRVAMYFIPLFLGSIAMIGDILYVEYKKNKILIPVFILLFIPVHFIYSMNLKYVNGYKTEVIPERFYEIIKNDEDNQGQYPATIGGYRMRMFCWTYMNFANGGSQNLIDYVSYPESQSDFQIVDIEENPDWLEDYKIIDTEEILGRKLIKRKSRPEYILIDEVVNNTPSATSNEYYRLAIWPYDSLTQASYYVTVDMDINSVSLPFNAWLVLNISDKNNNTLQYKYIPFDWLKTKWGKGKTKFTHSFLTGEIPESANDIRVFIWNLDMVEYEVENSTIKLLKVK